MWKISSRFFDHFTIPLNNFSNRNLLWKKSLKVISSIFLICSSIQFIVSLFFFWKLCNSRKYIKACYKKISSIFPFFQSLCNTVTCGLKEDGIKYLYPFRAIVPFLHLLKTYEKTSFLVFSEYREVILVWKRLMPRPKMPLLAKVFSFNHSLTLKSPTPQNGQTKHNNSPKFPTNWVCLPILWGWRLES